MIPPVAVPNAEYLGKTAGGDYRFRIHGKEFTYRPRDVWTRDLTCDPKKWVIEFDPPPEGTVIPEIMIDGWAADRGLYVTIRDLRFPGLPTYLEPDDPKAVRCPRCKESRPQLFMVTSPDKVNGKVVCHICVEHFIDMFETVTWEETDRLTGNVEEGKPLTAEEILGAFQKRCADGKPGTAATMLLLNLDGAFKVKDAALVSEVLEGIRAMDVALLDGDTLVGALYNLKRPCTRIGVIDAYNTLSGHVQARLVSVWGWTQEEADDTHDMCIEVPE